MPMDTDCYSSGSRATRTIILYYCCTSGALTIVHTCSRPAKVTMRIVPAFVTDERMKEGGGMSPPATS